MAKAITPTGPKNQIFGKQQQTTVNPNQIKLTPEELNQLWRPQDSDLSPSQVELLPKVRRWLERRRKNELADFLVGKPVEQLSRHSTKELTAHALTHFKPRSTAVAVVALLTKIIDRGNRENITGGLCPPPIAILIKTQPSPFHEDRWPKLEVAAQLRLLLENSLRSSKPLKRSKHDAQAVARISLGQILLSAIVHGGQIATASLTALLHQLNQPESPLQCLGDRLFIELSLSHRKHENAQFRRWFPDALSSVLILNSAADLVQIAANKEALDNDDLKKLIWPCLRAFLKSCNAFNQFPNTLKRLLDAVRLDLERQLPIYLANYAALRIVSHSLKPSVYRRLHGLSVNPGLDILANEVEQRGLDSPGTEIQKELRTSDDVESRWLRALRTAMKGPDRLEIIQHISSLFQPAMDDFQQGSVGELFAGFALRLFSTSNENHVKFAVSTAKAYVISACTRLGSLIGLSVDDFGSEEWSSLYEEALGDCESPGVKRNLVRVLREFQRYLEVERGAEVIDKAEIFGVGSGLVPVDANVIAEQEFLAIRDRFAQGTAAELPFLAQSQDGARLTDLSWLILTLAYRCGLRRMEALKLELLDVLIHRFPELLVRPNEYRRLKTKSSTRKLPLFALLTREENERLKQWCKRRLDEESQSPYSIFLFALPASDFQFVPQDGLFKLLHRVMRDVTGDKSLRFHHLRHSFASRMMVLFAANSPGLQARILQTLPGYANAFANADLIRSAILGKTGPTRRLVWAVCCLLGHSGPDVSLEHYIHHLDILLAEALIKESIAPSIAAVTQASGKSSAQAYRHLKMESMNAWAVHLYKKQIKCTKSEVIAASAAAKPGDSKPPIVDPVAAKEDDVSLSLKRIWFLLFDIKTSRKSIDEISQRSGFSEGRLHRYSTNADWLFSLPLSKNSGQRRHRFMTRTPDRRQPDVTHDIAVPLKPAESRDIKVAARLGAEFIAIYIANRQAVDKVVLQYARGARPDFGGMVFTNPDRPSDAIAFLNFLKMIKLNSDEIEFISYDVTSKRSPSAQKWRRALGLHSSIKISKKSPFNNRKDWACPWIGILPVFQDEHGRKTGSAGFRFLMVMAAITIRREDDGEPSVTSS